MATSTDLVPITAAEDSPYELMRLGNDEVRELVGEALSPGESLGIGDLTRIKVPAGGATAWQVPSITGGEDSMKELTGVILRADTRRAYWVKEYDGANDPPDCASSDGIHGIVADEASGLPGGVCAECPFNEFGSGRNEVGKACKETRVIFLLPPDSILPYVLNVPPASLANFKAYRVGLLRGRRKITQVQTTLRLEKTKSTTGIDYARITPVLSGVLDEAAAEAIKTYAEILAPNLDRAADDIRREDVDS